MERQKLAIIFYLCLFVFILDEDVNSTLSSIFSYFMFIEMPLKHLAITYPLTFSSYIKGNVFMNDPSFPSAF